MIGDIMVLPQPGRPVLNTTVPAMCDSRTNAGLRASIRASGAIPCPSITSLLTDNQPLAHFVAAILVGANEIVVLDPRKCSVEILDLLFGREANETVFAVERAALDRGVGVGLIADSRTVAVAVGARHEGLREELPARREHAMYLADDSAGVGERIGVDALDVENAVEAAARIWQRRGVALRQARRDAGALEIPGRLAQRDPAAVEPIRTKPFAGEIPEIGARPAADFQNLDLGTIRRAIIVAGHESDQLLGRISSPCLLREQLIPAAIPNHQWCRYLSV